MGIYQNISQNYKKFVIFTHIVKFSRMLTIDY